jgi:hypothetical protein
LPARFAAFWRIGDSVVGVIFGVRSMLIMFLDNKREAIFSLTKTIGCGKKY